MAFGQGNYGSGNRRGGNSYGGHRGGFGGGFNKPSFPARCNECGNSCTVPFKPNGSKPVLCQDCFRRNDGGGDSRSFDRAPSFNRFNDRFDDRPRRAQSGPAPVGPSLKSEIQSINRKLDQILAILNEVTIQTQDDESEEESEQEEMEHEETKTTEIE